MARFWNPTWRSRWPTAARLQADPSGAVALEYGLIAALVTIAILGSLRTLGVSLVSLPLPSLVAALQSVAP
ncbi:MAG TPA: Flp family type IVb pilin [Geminicoccaceae bacterium]|nr:Flp family type IVb pilin [Geminicoccaceae bacterium]